VQVTTNGATNSLTWAPSAGASTYNIQRCTGNGCSGGSVVGTVSGASFSESTPSGNATFGYSVNAVDASNNASSFSSPAYVLLWDYEAGTLPTPPSTPDIVPMAINATDGNPSHYVRQTATPADCGPAYFITCPRTRSECCLQPGYNGIPVVEGQTRTYFVDIRIPSGQSFPSTDLLLWQSFQEPPVSSRPVWIGIHDFGAGPRFYLGNRVPPCPASCVTVAQTSTAQVIDLGPLVFDQWIRYQVAIVLAITPTNGTVSVSANGVPKGTLTGQPTLFDSSQLNIYTNVINWFGGTTVADYDNILQMSGSVSAADVTPPSTPQELIIQ